MSRRLLSILASLALFGALGCQAMTGRALTASKEPASNEETAGAVLTNPGSTDLPIDRPGTGPSEPTGPGVPAERKVVMGATPVSGTLPPLSGEPVDVAMRSGVPNRFVPAFGPDVMPPMSDSQDVGHDNKPTAQTAPAAEPVALKDAADLPTPDAFRMILDSQSYSLNELDFALPASLPLFAEGKLNEVFVAQAHNTQWWDILQGPTVRAVIFGPNQTPNEGRYADLPIIFDGLKESDSAWNLDVKLAAAPGEKIAFYLFYDPDLTSASSDAYFRTPEGFHADTSSLVTFASPEKATAFFADTAHVFPLGQFNIVPRKDEPRIVLEVAFSRNSQDGWQNIPNNSATITNIYPEDGIVIQAQEKTGSCANCVAWKVLPEGSQGRLYVERKTSGQIVRLFRDFGVGPSGTIKLKDLGVKTNDTIRIAIPYTSEKPLTWTEAWTTRDYSKKDQYQQRSVNSAAFRYLRPLPTLPPERNWPR